MKVFWGLLCVLIGVMGCQKETTITIAGAVNKPGEYAFISGKKVADYIALAGGYTDEAVVNDVAVARLVPEPDGSYRSVQLPVTDTLRVNVNDYIRVPAQTYVVHLDSARIVKNLRLEIDSLRVDVPRGVLVPGVMDKGPVVAMILGRGKGYDLPDTNTATSAFHYLYVHLHPDAYERVLTFAGETIDSLEALEDAQEIHRRVFEKRDYQVLGAAELPPKGHFVVLQGILLTPRTEQNPGAGLRRRRFEDGRVWTTFDDGRQRWQYSDGRVVLTFPNGSEEVRYRDGRVAYTDAQGNVRTTFADGHESWKLKNGTLSTFYPDGRLMRKSPNGDVFERDKSGTTRQMFADGSKRIDYADGRMYLKSASGHEETRYPDGRIVMITPDQDEVTLLPDGSQVTKMADGTVVRFESDGRIEKSHISGAVTNISADGVRRDVFPDGSTMVQRPDGSRVVRYLQGDVLETRADGYAILKARDGTTQETFPDGRILGKKPNGASWEIFPDGRKVQVTSLGHRIETFPDGQQKVSLGGVYGYPTLLRDDLASLDDFEKKVQVGEKILVTGTVVDSVLDVHVVAYRVPLGDVIEANVDVVNGRFQGDLKLPEEGHYRLQVQVEMPKLRTMTAVHQAVVVGTPEPITQKVLSVTPYPGDDLGALVLVDLVNESRLTLRRRQLKVDRFLMKIAQERLREMILKGEVSHLSKSDEDVRHHMYRSNVQFWTVGENVASSHYLETMHEGWMLSAGHRMNILDPRWTHMGAAVTEVGGMLWGVEVFAGW